MTLYCTAPGENPDGEGTQGGSLYKAFRALWEQYEGDARQRSVCARVLAFYFLMEEDPRNCGPGVDKTMPGYTVTCPPFLNHS